MKKEIILTGDRPTGKLHLGHYVGSLKRRVELQNSGKYLAVGIDPNKSTIFVQSQVPELNEITMHYLNLVTVSRLNRNPTVKDEIKQKNFESSIPAGFLIYPVSQAADITAFKAKFVPVGEDQLPMIEQTREIVRSFNSIYGDILVERLPGIDGKAKMSKSLNNGIYISDEPDIIKKKIMSMYTDPNHIRVSDPGKVEGNTVFTYLDVFCKDIEYLERLKNEYRKGGLGDVKIKKYLNEIIQEELEPIRKRRKELEQNKDEVYKILKLGSEKARNVAAKTLKEIREAIGIEYFEI